MKGSLPHGVLPRLSTIGSAGSPGFPKVSQCSTDNSQRTSGSLPVTCNRGRGRVAAAWRKRRKLWSLLGSRMELGGPTFQLVLGSKQGSDQQLPSRRYHLHNGCLLQKFIVLRTLQIRCPRIGRCPCQWWLGLKTADILWMWKSCTSGDR